MGSRAEQKARTRNALSHSWLRLIGDGANFALVDGSVRWVSDSIEFRACSRNGVNCWNAFDPGDARYEPVYGVYKRLGRRNDGLPIVEFCCRQAQSSPGGQPRCGPGYFAGRDDRCENHESRATRFRRLGE